MADKVIAPGVRVSRERLKAPQVWLRAAEPWALPAILLLAFALRIHRLGDQNIWWDEGLAIWAVRKGLTGVTLWTAQDVHPPLYFWTLLAWVRLAGESEFAARYISLVWGMLTVAVVYALGARLGGRRAGLLAALLIAVARFHVWWSQEMRMYVLAALAATLALYAAVRWLDEEDVHRQGAKARRNAKTTAEPGKGSSAPSWRSLAPWRLGGGSAAYPGATRLLWPLCYVLAAVGCFYTIYLAALAPLVANGYALLALARTPAARRAGVALRWLAAQALVLVLFLPWLYFAWPRMHNWSVAEPFSFRTLLVLYSTLLTIGISTHVEQYLPYLLPFAAVLGGGLATLLWRRRRPEPGLSGGQAGLLLVLALICLPLTVFVLTRPRSLFYTPRVEARYLVLFAPAFYVFLAWSTLRLGRRSLLLGLLALALCLGPMLAFLPGYYRGRYLRDDYETLVRMLGAHARPGDEILLISGDRYPLFFYYYERLVPAERRVPVVQLPHEADLFTAANVDAQLQRATAGHGRFWVAAVDTNIQDPAALSLPWLDGHFPRALTHDVGHNSLILYGEAASPLTVERKGLAAKRPLAVQAGGVELLGYDLPGHEYQVDDTIDLGLYWASQAPVQIEVQWLHDNGRLLGSLRQTWPATAPEAGRTMARFLVPVGCPAGGTHFLLRWWSPGADEMALQTVRLPGPRILAERCPACNAQITHPLDITFADGIRLLGYDLHPPLRDGRSSASPGGTLVLDLFWEASEPLSEDYTTFTHVIGSAHNPRSNGPLWGQHDGLAGGEKHASRTWQPGQMILDRHEIGIDGDAPPGDYELEVGLYSAATGRRLRLILPGGGMGDDRVVLAEVQVKRN